MKNLHTLLTQGHASRRPVWFMRQAGRWLPEYRALRQRERDFVRFCLTPDLAIEATLQPLRRLDLDAAIVFADILLVPFALGQDVAFVQEAGPVLPPLRTVEDVAALQWNLERLQPVAETLRGVCAVLQPHQTLIGFAGSPWTVACYMIEGRGKTGFSTPCQMARDHHPVLDALVALLEESTLAYLTLQINAGAEVVQLFESWAGLLTDNDAAFVRYVIAPTKRLVTKLRQQHPTVPVIGFPRGASLHHYGHYQQATGVDGVSVDHHQALSDIHNALGNTCALQGNLDPNVLVVGGEALSRAVDSLLHAMPWPQTRHIFNLGHGVLPETPLDHVALTLARIRENA